MYSRTSSSLWQDWSCDQFGIFYRTQRTYYCPNIHHERPAHGPVVAVHNHNIYICNIIILVVLKLFALFTTIIFKYAPENQRLLIYPSPVFCSEWYLFLFFFFGIPKRHEILVECDMTVAVARGRGDQCVSD